jgi:hypothetical protein
MAKLNRAISSMLIYSLFLFAFISFILYGPNFNLLTLLALFALGLLLHKLIDKAKLNENYKLFIGLAIWLNALAYTYLYQQYLYFGYIVHFTVSILITFTIYDYYKKNFKTGKIYLVIFIFLTVIGIVGMWEVFEYFDDIIFHIHLQGIIVSTKFLVYPIDDTMWDVTIGAIGSLLALIVKEIISVSRPTRYQ